MAGTVWVIGSGRFGRRAALGLRSRWRVLAVDPSEQALRGLPEHGVETRCEDGVVFLVRELGRGPGPDWIVPALPLHLAAEWVRAVGGGRWRRTAVPGWVRERLPHAVGGEGGDLYVSRADFRCPPDCPEPADRCLYTGEPRGEDLFRGIEAVVAPGLPVRVIRSRQLGPGVGGYRPAELRRLAADLAGLRGLVVVATACRCHGVLTALDAPGGEEPT